MATRSELARQEEIAGYLFLSPWIIGFVVFTAGPILASLVLSFTDWELAEPPNFVGLQNYAYMFTRDLLFWQSLKVTGLYLLGHLPLGIALGLAVALLMNQNVLGIAFYRTVYYLPSVVSGVAVAILWTLVFNNKFGIINMLLQLINIEGPDWLIDESWALPALILMSFWGIGGGMIVLLASLQGVPTELYEAAQIDGANRWTRFIAVTIPMISPVIFLNVVTGIIGTLQTFTTAFIMTAGGPNYATYFYALHVYNNAFTYNTRMGYASALAWVLFLITLILTLVIFRSAGYWVYYAGEREEAR